MDIKINILNNIFALVSRKDKLTLHLYKDGHQKDWCWLGHSNNKNENKKS